MKEKTSHNRNPDQISHDPYVDDVADDYSLVGFSADLFDNIALDQSWLIVPPAGITQSSYTAALDFFPILSQSNSVPDVPFIDTPRQSPEPIGDIVHQPKSHFPVSAKPKRRRVDRGFTNSGPNRFGRKGTIRCERCRHWRQRVYFTFLQ